MPPGSAVAIMCWEGSIGDSRKLARWSRESHGKPNKRSKGNRKQEKKQFRNALNILDVGASSGTLLQVAQSLEMYIESVCAGLV